MTDLDRRKRKRKKLLKSKLGGMIAAFIMFIILSAIIVGLLLLIGAMNTQQLIENRLSAEIDKAVFLKQTYAAGGKDADPGVFENSGMDHILFDEHGNIVSSNGRDTRGTKSIKYLVTSNFLPSDSSLSDEELINKYTYCLYSDKDNLIIDLDTEYDDFDIHYWEYAKLVLKGLKNIDTLVNNDADGDDSDAVLIRTDMDSVQTPLWVRLDIPEIGQTLYVKCAVSTSMSESFFTIAAMAIFGVVEFIFFIMFIVILIKGLLNNRRMRNMLFTDIKIDGHNWLWFIYHAENTLSKYKNAKKGFALIDLQFIGYRRFCVCNSVDEGEGILKEVFRRLNGYVSRKELCAHNAEDSFALLLFCDDDSGLKTRLELILRVLGEAVQNNSLAFHAGIYTLPALEGGVFTVSKNVDVESDFNNACAASATLSGSEHSGIAFYNDKLVEEQRWIETVTHLQQKALDNEEFLVYYQPKYDPRTHELRGAEALIRWQSPEHGFLSPYRFIPIFENNGFITEIDHYMISHVARDQKRWLDAGLRCVPVSVNVSRAHFIESDLAEQIRNIVDKEGAPHSIIEIELTESAFFDDKNAMIETIEKLKSYGFAVSMDDFGSGYSSLNSLKDMPLDVLKLDAEFFRGEAAETDRGEIVVSEAIKLAKNLNMRTVAEGVEIKEQVEFLAEQGCDMIQGYYFAKPMPHDEYEERIKLGRSDGADEEETANE